MKNLLTLISILFFLSCGENLIEEVKERYNNGKLKLVYYYKKVGDNQILKRIINYHENGQIKDEENYKDGKLNGKQISYYSNGKIYSEKNYKNGIKEGKWSYYNKNGIIKKDNTYTDGELTEEKIKPNAKYCSDCGRYH